MTKLGADDRGFAAVWVAVVLLFLIGSAALAVDASEFWEDARFEQTVADLACLAGVRHLPEDPDTARQKAVDFTKANWDVTRMLAPVVTGSGEVTLSDGTGNRVVITAPFGDPTKMRVHVTQEPPTHFGRVIGATSVTVVQEAYCQTLGLGPGTLPFGDLPGGMDQYLQSPPPCGASQGNCARLDIDRNDTGGINNRVAMNIAYGADREVTIYDPTVGARTCSPSGVDPCNFVSTFTGSNVPQNTTGMLKGGLFGVGAGDGRLENPAFANPAKIWNYSGSPEDGDSLDDVAVYTFPAPGSPPAWYSEAINGPWTDNYFVTELKSNGCASPRIVRTPILVVASQYDDWAADPEGYTPTWPPGTSQDMYVVGFHWAFIDKPAQASDVGPGPQLRRIEAIPLQLADDILCVGPNAPTRPFQPGDPKVIRLVDG